MGLLDTTPPDNTGTDTIDRFRYQAQLSVQYCLECACGGRVKSVILEHFEDIVVEYENEWFFVQVKTRDSGQPYWRLSTAKNGLESLHRAFSQTKGLPAKYSLLLEGGIAGDDILSELVPGNGPKSDDLKKRVGEILGIDDIDCAEFLGRTSVQPNQPPRSTIDAYIKDLLGKSADHMSQAELTTIKDGLTDELFAAMAEARLEGLIPSFISDPDNSNVAVSTRIAKKRFDRERLLPFLSAVIFGPLPLLKRVTELDAPPPTNLEKKLLAAGASEAIIKNAKSLRANAVQRNLEARAAGLFDDEVLEDVRHRIESIAVGIPSASKPCNETWSELREALQAQAGTVDPRRVYGRDPFLLLGAACELSDECLFDWGVSIA